ncbi:MAG: glycosyltransferase family 9 protein [Halomonadaceae bacterium]|jgi:ADP-heptose:LPS heptosyltransferase
MNRRRVGRYLLEAWYDYQPEPFDPGAIRSAVIFMPKSIGDGMGIYPVIRALQARGVEWLGIVASHRSAPVYEALKSEGIEVFEVSHDRDYRAVRGVAREIRRRHGEIDLCVEATTLISSPSIYFVGTLRARMNLQLSGSRMKLYAPLCNIHAPHYLEASPPQNWASLMRDAGVAEVPGRFELPVPATVANEVKPWLDTLGAYLVFNLDGSVRERQISLAKAKEMLPEIHRAQGLAIVVPFDSAGRAKAEALAEAFPYVHAYPGEPSILRTAEMIKHAQLLISPDTSAIHIASAYDIPTLGLYHRLEPVWRPRASANVVTLVEGPLTDLPLSQCLNALNELYRAMKKRTLPQPGIHLAKRRLR